MLSSSLVRVASVSHSFWGLKHLNRIRLCVVLVLHVLHAGCERAEQWPARPVTLLCPWSAGGGTDRVSRQMAVQLEGELGVPVNVVNATGGGGVTGHARGALARPDGYTLLMATVELNMLHWRGLCPVTWASYRPLGKLNEDSAAVFVRADSQWQTVTDLEEAFRDATAPVAVSGSASGSIWHLALAGWLLERDLPMASANWISSKGSAPSLQELLARGVDVVCCSIPEAATLVDAGEVRCLGVMSAERCPTAPEIPTFAEQGVEWSVGGWRGMMYPPGVSEDRVQRMEAAIAKVAASDEFRNFMDEAGFNMSICGGEEFGRFLEQADKDFGAILTQPAMRQQQQAPLSPWFMPILLGVLGVIAGGVGVSTRRPAPAAKVTAPENDLRMMVVCTGAIAAFAAVLDTVGYVVAASLLMSSLLLLLRVRLLTVSVVVLTSVPVTYHAFSVLLGVPLPWGWLGW